MPARLSRDCTVNLSNLNAKPLRFLMADINRFLSRLSGRIPWETSETREGRGGGRGIIFFFFFFVRTHRRQIGREKRGREKEEYEIVREEGRGREERREDSELISLLAVASLNCPRPPSFSPFRPRSLCPPPLPSSRTYTEPEVEQFIQARILLVTRHESRARCTLADQGKKRFEHSCVSCVSRKGRRLSDRCSNSNEMSIPHE